jgi:hypothetical protein
MLWYLCLASLFVLAEFGLAYWDGFAFAWQVRALPIAPAKFLDFWRHAGMWGDFFIINPILAYLLDAHGKSWKLATFGVVFLSVALVGALLLIPLLKDSRTIPSAFTRDGLLTLVGGMHYVYFTVATTVVAMLYVFTPRQEINDQEVIVITLCLIVHWGLGVLQPPYAAHGDIHLPAQIFTGLGWLTLLGLAVRLLYLV